MSGVRTLVVIGAGLAGAKVAEAARAAGHDGRIILIGEEASVPYERPPLSKAVLRGEASTESTQVHPHGFYADHDIELLTDRATGLDVGSRQVTLGTGGRLPFDTLVLATGAAPRALRIPGAGLDGVHLLRTVDDAVRLGEAIRVATRVAVVGAGWIGSEVAASARQMGADVVLIDPAPVPLHRVLGVEIGEVFRSLHAEHGVSLRMNAGVRALRGAEAVEAVELDDGRLEPADVVVVGVGVVPRLELARAARLPVDDGVVVDQHLETPAAGIFAAGDVANAWHPHYRRHLRVEHWANALNQGTAAGRNATGRHEPYTRLPYFFSDQYELGLEYTGRAGPDDAIVVRGDREARQFVAFWHRDDIVTAAMNVNVWDLGDALTAMISTRRPVDVDRLVDVDIPLAELARR